jgi:hypothetical protein
MARGEEEYVDDDENEDSDFAADGDDEDLDDEEVEEEEQAASKTKKRGRKPAADKGAKKKKKKGSQYFDEEADEVGWVEMHQHCWYITAAPAGWCNLQAGVTGRLQLCAAAVIPCQHTGRELDECVVLGHHILSAVALHLSIRLGLAVGPSRICTLGG